MKVVLDIETIQAPREEWARLAGKPPSSGDSEPAGEGYDLFTAGLPKLNDVQRMNNMRSRPSTARSVRLSVSACWNFQTSSSPVDRWPGMAGMSGSYCDNSGTVWLRTAPRSSLPITVWASTFRSLRSDRSSTKSSQAWMSTSPSSARNRFTTRWRSGAIGIHAGG